MDWVLLPVPLGYPDANHRRDSESLNPAGPDLEAWEGKGIIEEVPSHILASSLSRPNTQRLREVPVPL